MRPSSTAAQGDTAIVGPRGETGGYRSCSPSPEGSESAKLEDDGAPPESVDVTDLTPCRKDQMMAPMRSRSDAELLAGTPADPEAFGEFYRRHERGVVAFFLHWSRSPELAADLTAETFAAALGSLSGYRCELGEPRAWLFGVARHVLARSLERGRVEDRARRRLGIPPLLVDDDALERIEAIASLNGSVLELLDDLSGPVRAAVSGRVLEEREYRELARSLACSPSVVRQRVRRGLARLRERMETER